MSFRFNPKNIRRLVVLLAMIAPPVYLFGSLFFGLQGAHGEQVFAEPVYVEEYLPADYAVDNPFIADFTQESLEHFILDTADFNFSCTVSFNGIDYSFFRLFDYSGYRRLQVVNSDIVIQYNYSTQTFSNATGTRFIFKDGDFLNISQRIFPYADLYVLSSVPSGDAVVNPGANSDFVFGQYFAKDNFVEKIGENVLSQSPAGFAPFAEFLKYMESNMLHVGNTQLGCMAYGYSYWCMHVLLFDLLFMVATFFLSWISNLTDKISGGAR